MVTLKEIEDARWIDEDEKEGTVETRIITRSFQPSDVPDKPGVYAIYVKKGDLIESPVYFGSSSDLRSIENSLFQSKFNLFFEKVLKNSNNEIIFEFLVTPQERFKSAEKRLKKLLRDVFNNYRFELNQNIQGLTLRNERKEETMDKRLIEDSLPIKEISE